MAPRKFFQEKPFKPLEVPARRAWPKVYVVSVEDPFDVSDNCARTIHPDRIARIAGAFAAASEALLRATDSAGAQPSHQNLHLSPQACTSPPHCIYRTAQFYAAAGEAL